MKSNKQRSFCLRPGNRRSAFVCFCRWLPWDARFTFHKCSPTAFRAACAACRPDFTLRALLPYSVSHIRRGWAHPLSRARRALHARLPNGTQTRSLAPAQRCAQACQMVSALAPHPLSAAYTQTDRRQMRSAPALDRSSARPSSARPCLCLSNFWIDPQIGPQAVPIRPSLSKFWIVRLRSAERLPHGMQARSRAPAQMHMFR